MLSEGNVFSKARKENELFGEICQRLRLVLENCGTPFETVFTRAASGGTSAALVSTVATFTENHTKNIVMDVAPSNKCASSCIESLNYMFSVFHTYPVVDHLCVFGKKNTFNFNENI